CSQARATGNLAVLPCGPLPANPGELFTDDRLGRIMAWAEGRYDRILCDSPPLLAFADGMVASRLVDGVLLVVRADKGVRAAAACARDLLHSTQSRVLGVIVNRLHGGNAYGYRYYRTRVAYADYRNQNEYAQHDKRASREAAKKGDAPAGPFKNAA